MKRYWVAAAAATLLAAAFGGWLLIPREDAKVVRVREIGRQLFDDKADPLPEEERRRLRERLREETKDLTDKQRETLAEDGRKGFEERIDRFFTMSPAERTAYLDAQIDRMEQWRTQAKGRDRNAPSGKGSGGDAKGGGGPRGPGGAARAPLNSQQRQERGRAMLDRTTPEQRAKFSEFFRQMNQRRAERGLPTFGPFGLL